MTALSLERLQEPQEQQQFGPALDVSVNDNADLQEQVESRIASLGYLCDSRTLYGHGGRDVYYLVGDPNWRLVWCRWEPSQQMSFEHAIDGRWHAVWRGPLAAFLHSGPDVDIISPVRAPVRRLGAALAHLRIARADVFCRWDGQAQIAGGNGSDSRPLGLRLVALDPALNGRRLMLTRQGMRCVLTVTSLRGMVAAGKDDNNTDTPVILASRHTAELVAGDSMAETTARLRLFLKTRATGMSTVHISTMWKSFHRAVASFLTTG